MSQGSWVLLAIDRLCPHKRFIFFKNSCWNWDRCNGFEILIDHMHGFHGLSKETIINLNVIFTAFTKWKMIPFFRWYLHKLFYVSDKKVFANFSCKQSNAYAKSFSSQVIRLPKGRNYNAPCNRNPAPNWICFTYFFMNCIFFSTILNKLQYKECNSIFYFTLIDYEKLLQQSIDSLIK